MCLEDFKIGCFTNFSRQFISCKPTFACLPGVSVASNDSDSYSQLYFYGVLVEGVAVGPARGPSVKGFAHGTDVLFR